MKRPNDDELAELTELAERNGVLTPEAVLLQAQNPASALHRRFTWDDAEAAKLRRLDEARNLIMRVKVRIQPRPDQPPITVRAFVSLSEDRVQGGGYRHIETVLSDAAMRADLLQTAIAELQALQQRYKHLSELAKVFGALESVANDVTQKAG